MMFSYIALFGPCDPAMTPAEGRIEAPRLHHFMN